MIRELILDRHDVAGLTALMNQWDDITHEITYDDIFDKITKIKQTNLKTAIFIAETDAIMTGYAYLTEVHFLGMDSFIELQSILVDKNHRGNGIGKSLLSHSEKWAKETGHTKLMLSSRVQLENAHKFYTGLGYTVAKQSYFFQKKLY
jgi:GNAT superfamily N-acetyltransferase